MTLMTTVVWLACLQFVLDCMPGAHHLLVLVSAKQRHGVTTTANAILQARCEAACASGGDHHCVEDCLARTKENPGECPVNSPGLEGACIKECSYDTQCPEIQKCCAHSCGITCRTPAGLLHYQGLPNVPNNLTAREIRKNKSAQMSWNLGEENENVFYVLQQSSHPGKQYNPSSLGPWTTRHLTKRNSAVVKDLRPGNFYVFRVASVNANGTKGYSEPSEPFTLSEGPKPPKAPTNLRVVNAVMVDGLLWAELLWNAPHSDLPIQRYKVYWSLRLLPGPPPSPLLVRHRNVPHGKTSFILKKLKPDAEYFLQVEAYSQFGKERLKGEKGNLSFNTTDYKNGSDFGNTGRLAVKRLWVKKLNNEIKARISWSGAKYTAGSVPKFIITWKNMTPCAAEKTEMSVTTHSHNYDLFGLHPGCKYSVNVKEIGLGYTRSSKEIYISTPM